MELPQLIERIGLEGVKDLAYLQMAAELAHQGEDWEGPYEASGAVATARGIAAGDLSILTPLIFCLFDTKNPTTGALFQSVEEASTILSKGGLTFADAVRVRPKKWKV